MRGSIQRSLKFAALKDYYGNLLTEKQRMILHLYYDEDLSLVEISNNCEMSRQCAFEIVRTAEKRLLEIEQKIGFVGKMNQVLNLLEKVREKSLKIQNENEKVLGSKKVSKLTLEIEDEIKKFVQGECLCDI